MRAITRQVTFLIILIIAFCSFPACSQSPSSPAEPPQASDPAVDLPGAAIIDQLYTLQPNTAFINEVSQELEDCGFEVDLYQGDEVTVDLYRKLPGYGYKLIIFRAHSGLLSNEGEVVRKTSLFTNEPYSETGHVAEQLADRLAMARINKNYPYVFSIKDTFIAHAMQGEFNDTVIIMMGCSCLHIDDLAKAFIEKGASSYVAWHATVGLGYVDKATPYLIKKLCQEGLTIKGAVGNTMSDIGPDPQFGARLKYYPPQSGDKTLKQLTEQ